MIPTDPHDRLLTKAFGDLDMRPFAWCFDEEQAPSVEPHHSAKAVIHVRNGGRGKPSPCDDPLLEPHAALEEPRDGETYISSWGELQYAMTDGAMGTPPQKMLRRYEPTRQK